MMIARGLLLPSDKQAVGLNRIATRKDCERNGWQAQCPIAQLAGQALGSGSNDQRLYPSSVCHSQIRFRSRPLVHHGEAAMARFFESFFYEP
jgi:hypothetical protein